MLRKAVWDRLSVGAISSSISMVSIVSALTSPRVGIQNAGTAGTDCELEISVSMVNISDG